MQDWCNTWFLLHISQTHWRILLSVLEGYGVEFCCPMLYSGRTRKDKKNCVRHTVRPAFEGYVFVQFNPEEISFDSFLRMPGARDFVRFGGVIQQISAQTIQALRCAEARVINSDCCSYECIGVNEADVAQIIEIYDMASPWERTSKLMALISQSNFNKEGKNAA
ncbi:hypothetical protein KGK29_004585 [Salmonella enterica]|nr:hypothetical protein [Salmonella enterica]